MIEVGIPFSDPLADGPVIQSAGTVALKNGMKANPDLKWETTTSRNIGFDFGLWGSRLSGTLDLYWNTTSDLLMRQEIDSSTGYSYQYRNIGQTSNKGVELALTYHLIRTKDFNLNVSATLDRF